MKIWIENSSTHTHHIIYLSKEGCEGASFLGEYDDNEIRDYFSSISSTVDVEKNLKLLHYFGYLHIFAKKENI